MLLATGVDVVMRQAGQPPDRLPPRDRAGPRGPPGGVAAAPQPAGVDGPRGVRRLPRALAMRELRVRVDKPGFRTREFVVVTSLLDPEAFPREELAGLYRARWHAELDIRSIKQTMKMDVLRCKTPEMVRKEFWAHLLAYNLIRGVMAEAARRHGLAPRQSELPGGPADAGGVPLPDRAVGLRGGRAAGRCVCGRSRIIGWGTGPTAWSRGW